LLALYFFAKERKNKQILFIIIFRFGEKKSSNVYQDKTKNKILDNYESDTYERRV